jgi:hypothetical protein
MKSVSSILNGWGENPKGWDDVVNTRLEWRKARLLDQLGEYEQSLDIMTRIVDETPLSAPTILPIVRAAAMETAGRMGRADEVDRWCAQHNEGKTKLQNRGNIRRSPPKPFCAEVSDLDDVNAFISLGNVRSALYSGLLSEAEILLSKATSDYGESLQSRFLEAEIARSGESSVEALRIYEKLEKAAQNEFKSSSTGNTWVRDLRVQTLIQAAEICISRREYERAEKLYDEACDAEPRETLYANFIRGRLRYLDRQLNPPDPE